MIVATLLSQLVVLSSPRIFVVFHKAQGNPKPSPFCAVSTFCCGVLWVYNPCFPEQLCPLFPCLYPVSRHIFKLELPVGAVSLAGTLWDPVKTSMPSMMCHISPKPGLSSCFEFLWFWVSVLTLRAALILLSAIPFLWRMAGESDNEEADAGSSVI